MYESLQKRYFPSLFVCLFKQLLDGIRGKIVMQTWEKGTSLNRNKYNACLTVRNNKTQTD